ncbi:T6SS immunity protein Tdi1 domain-containing protein [Streptomyces sp. NPDC050422]|uniref:T6SS immunity protein Tdi1 domain-containing protein n=1 Tax=Streptomyces sp. NPDC050422 TaxID=3365614 RepID=UPI0037958EBD
MYEKFLAAFPSDGGTSQPFVDPRLERLDGFNELVAFGAGLSFGNGIVRIHSEGEALRAGELIKESFSKLGDRTVPLAKDWLGRQFVVPLINGRARSGLLLLVEPGSGEVFDVDCGLVDLFSVEMVADSETFLAADLFDDWRERNSVIMSSDQCVGFKVPLFLGGEGSVDNLEVSDESVYWSLLGQIRSQS